MGQRRGRLKRRAAGVGDSPGLSYSRGDPAQR